MEYAFGGALAGIAWWEARAWHACGPQPLCCSLAHRKGRLARVTTAHAPVVDACCMPHCLAHLAAAALAPSCPSLPALRRPPASAAALTRLLLATCRLTSAGHEFDTPGVFATNPREAPGTVAWREAVPVGFTDLSQEEVHALVQRMGQEYKGNRCGRAAGVEWVAGSSWCVTGVQQLTCCNGKQVLLVVWVWPVLGSDDHSPSSHRASSPNPCRYHLLQMNCNHFSSDLCARLTGQPAPAWINRLASIAVSLHCLLPQGWVPPLRPPTAVPLSAQDLEQQERSRLLDPFEQPGPSEGPPRSAPQLIA